MRHAGITVPQPNPNNHGVKLIFAPAWIKDGNLSPKLGKRRLTAKGERQKLLLQTRSFGVRGHSDFRN
jgi:hypothetical protein